MTYRAFLKALRKTPRRGWYICYNTSGYKMIRLVHLASDMVYSPLTAVCKFYAGRELHVDMWPLAAEKLGLNRGTTQRIVIASEGRALRSKTQPDLLRATGLVK